MTGTDRLSGTGASLARFSVRQGVLVNLLFLLFLLAGGLAARRIAVDAYPNVDLDAAAVYTVWIGASPEEIDTLVTVRIEDELEGIRGIERIISESRPNRSSVLIKFKETLDDAEVDRAFQDIRSALERIDDLPEEAERPRLRRQTIFEIFPLVNVAVSYDEPGREMMARRVARELREDLLSIRGVAKIDDRNLREPEMTILLERAGLERYDLTLEEVTVLLEATNRNIPAGEISVSGGAEFAIKAAGNYLSADDIEDSIIRQDPRGAHVRVKDVGRVVSGFETRDTKSRYNGADAILLPVAKDEGQNSLSLVAAVREKLAEFEARGLPAGIKIGIAMDSSQIIRDRLTILLTNLASGIALVFFALWVAIGVRNAVLAIIGIPFCYLAALIFMDAIGVSVNAISLFAMVLVSGVIVDDALIVIENIYRHIEQGKSRKDAIVAGVKEVFWPVTSSALTTMAAFLPMLLTVGVVGEFFSIIPKVVVVTLLASLFECFIILPVHFLDFGNRRRNLRQTTDRRAWGIRLVSRVGPWLRERYDRMLRVCLRHRYSAAALLCAVAIFSVGLWNRLDTLLFPSDFQVFVVNMEMPADSSLEQTLEASKAMDKVLARVGGEGAHAGQIGGWITTGGAQFTEDNVLLIAPHIAQSFVSLEQGTGADPVTVRDATMQLMRRIRDEPRDAEEEAIARDLRRFDKIWAEAQQDGPPTGRPVAVRIRCDDMDIAEEVAGRIKAALHSMPGVSEIKDNHDEGRMEYTLSLRRERAAAQGISFARAAATLATANEGRVVSIFKDPGGLDDADVRVRLAPEDRKTIADLARVRLRNASGATIPLSSIASIDAERGDAGIYRFDGRRTVLVTAAVDTQITTAVNVNEALEKAFGTREFLEQYPSAALKFGGQFEETKKSFSSLLDAFYVALLAIYMILAAQFRSYAQPLVILVTVPFAFIGIVFGLYITGNPFTVMAGIAMIGLAGIAVNDAIVLVDFINQRRADGVEIDRAITEACHLRARPILLTSITTIAGLLPMAIGLTGFSKVWSPFATVICFGMLFSTILTLLVIPSFYLIVERFKERWGSRSANES